MKNRRGGGREKDPKTSHDNEAREQKKYKRENEEKEKLTWRRPKIDFPNCPTFVFLLNIPTRKMAKKRAAGAKKIIISRRRRGKK